MEHIEKNILEKYIISHEDFTPRELDNITAHIEHCSYCKEHAEKLTVFYDSVSKELQNEPTERDKAFAQKLLTRQRLALPEKKLALQERVDNALSTFVEIIEPYRRPLAQRIVRYIQIHPVKTAVRFSMAACLVGLALFFTKPFKDTNPALAMIKNYNVIVHNKEGEVLWKKGQVGLSEIPDYRIKDGVIGKYSRPDGINLRAVLVDDINNDGITEVLFAGGIKNIGQYTQDTLYCFNYNGDILWKYGAGKSIAFGRLDFTAYCNWMVADYFTVMNRQINKKQLFVLALQDAYSPSRLIEIDPSDGSEIQSYWHLGIFYSALDYDIDHDGTEEIILGGVNNNYDLACIAILDPGNIKGCGPSRPEYVPDGMSGAMEKYYLLLPISDLGKLLSRTKYNKVTNVDIVGKDFIRVTTEEINQDPPIHASIIYTFNKNFEVVAILADAVFKKTHNQLEKEGKLSEHYGPEYLQSLKDSIKYWDGEKFVNKPTMNRKYVELEIPRVVDLRY